MELTCSKCDTESEHSIAIGAPHYEYDCGKCTTLLQGDIRRKTGRHGSVSVRVAPCNCSQQKPNAAPFWDSETLALARQSKSGFRENKD
jgi:hypothetical protein